MPRKTKASQVTLELSTAKQHHPFTKVEVIGDASEDYAIAVMLEGHSEDLWFAENLPEFVDHQPGTTMSIAGRTLIRDEHGEWKEAKPK